MSRENEEIVRRFLEALGRRDHESSMAWLDPDVVWRNTTSFPGTRTITGAQAVIDFWTTLLESFEATPEDGLEIENLLASGNQVVAGVRSRAHGAGGGVPVDVRWALGLSLRAGRIERVEISGDFGSALEAAGWSNVDVVHMALAAFNDRDAPALSSLMTPDAELVPFRAAIEGTSYRGADAAVDFFADSNEMWTELHVEPGKIQDRGDVVLAFGRLIARGRGSGAEVEAHLAWVVRFRDGLISSLRTFTDPSEALEAAGLSE